MIIAVNTRLNKDEQPEAYEHFLFTMLDAMTTAYPQHQFIYFFDKPYEPGRHFAKNVLPVIAGPKTSTRLRLQYWFNYKIPALLRKHRAEVFLSLEAICSLRTNVPQCLLVSDCSFLQPASLIKKKHSRFFKKFTLHFLAKAAALAAVSESVKSALIAHYKINDDAIALIKPVASSVFKPVSWEEKVAIREKYADGRAYFLCSADSHQKNNLINLLKAFSLFKKRQKSNMLLLITGKVDAAFKKDLSSYKLRKDVVLLEQLTLNEQASVTAAAYTLIYLAIYSDLAIPALQAIQSEVPVIGTNSIRSICDKAALYVETANEASIAENMMLVFKDENLLKTLIDEGKSLISQHQSEKSTELLMQCIQKAVDD